MIVTPRTNSNSHLLNPCYPCDCRVMQHFCAPAIAVAQTQVLNSEPYENCPGTLSTDASLGYGVNVVEWCSSTCQHEQTHMPEHHNRFGQWSLNEPWPKKSKYQVWPIKVRMTLNSDLRHYHMHVLESKVPEVSNKLFAPLLKLEKAEVRTLKCTESRINTNPLSKSFRLGGQIYHVWHPCSGLVPAPMLTHPELHTRYGHACMRTQRTFSFSDSALSFGLNVRLRWLT